MQLSFRLDKRPGESHLALDGKKNPECGSSLGETCISYSGKLRDYKTKGGFVAACKGTRVQDVLFVLITCIGGAVSSYWMCIRNWESLKGHCLLKYPPWYPYYPKCIADPMCQRAKAIHDSLYKGQK